MKKIAVIIMATLMTGCGVYKSYQRPDIETKDLYGAGMEQADTTSMGNVAWEDFFRDEQLKALIREGLEHNTDMQKAHLRVEEAEATLKSARLSYLPSFNVAPQGALSSFDNANTVKTYNIPLTASWEVDIFNGITNAKRKAKAVYATSREYVQAVRTQLVAGIANLYYTLLMLDRQYEISVETAEKWNEGVRTMRALKRGGMANEAAVAQYEGNRLAVEASLQTLSLQITTTENSLATLLGRPVQKIERGRLDEVMLPEELLVGVPVQMLSNRPDVRMAEQSLMQSYYATAEARSALYPKLTLNGTIGWTNNSGRGIVNPGKMLLSAAASLLQPIFNAGAGRARVKIAKAQQQEAMLSFEQTLLNAGAEVNNALTQTQNARKKNVVRNAQVEALARAVEKTDKLMRYSSATYLEVLTAQQALLSAQLSQVGDRFEEIQGVVNLYHALGGGRDLEREE